MPPSDATAARRPRTPLRWQADVGNGLRGESAGKKGKEATLVAVGEVRPDATIGGIQELVWLENEMIAIATTNGFLRLVQYNAQQGALLEDQHKPCGAGVVSACLCQKSGHIAIANNEAITFFDPLLLQVAQTMSLPTVADGVRYQKLQADPSGDVLFLGRSDGCILRVPVPSMPRADLSLLAIRRRSDAEASASGLPASTAGMVGATCGAPQLAISMSAAEGATSGYGSTLLHAWSQQRRCLAVVNDRKELVVHQRHADGTSTQVRPPSRAGRVPTRPPAVGRVPSVPPRATPAQPSPSACRSPPSPRAPSASEPTAHPRLAASPPLPRDASAPDAPSRCGALPLHQVLKELLPEAAVSLSWDPSSQSVLAIAIRQYGVALWDTKTDAGVTMWSGMAYKTFNPLAKSTRAFDPLIAKWNLAGQLAVGMTDGSFAVWDSMSMAISTSGSSGRHRGPITAGDW